jgi:hypothetical protein
MRSHSIGRQFLALSFVTLFISGLFVGALTAINPQKAQAVSGGDFNPGRIIDDGVFTDSGAMSVADIQNFLNAKVPSCDVNGTKNSSHWNASANRYYTRAEWGALNGHPAPYTCLKMYYENTSTFANNGSDPNISVPGGKSAAQIIWDSAQKYSINPQVILVTLQKEQSLITDDWPWGNQYDFALGWGCPDTAACNQNYKGFYKQVDKSAWQFRYYLEHPGDYNYWVGNYYVQYNPNASCGGKVINIQNAATAALYIYTPYQPNTAALNNVYGLGDNCSAYGNRNFWVFFTDWFGSTYASSYSYQVTGQYAYTDQTKTKGMGTHNLLPGTRVYAGVKVKNTGNRTWLKTGSNPVYLGTVRNIDRSSPFCDSSWVSCNRPAVMQETSVAPGQTATFEFWMTAPNSTGNFNEYFSLVATGAAWMPDTGLYFGMSVAPPTYTWRPVGQYAYTDQTKTKGKSMTSLVPGDRVYVGVRALNTGNMPWKNSGPTPVDLGTIRGIDRSSAFYDSSWLGYNRPARLVESQVNPGETGTFEFWMTASKQGTFAEYFAPVVKGVTWMNDAGLNFYSTVEKPVYTWQLTGQYAYKDQAKTVGAPTVNMNPGDRVYVGFRAKNTGNMPWKNGGPNPVNVGMTHPLDRLSLFMDVGWLGQNRPARLVESQVNPGETGTFEFWMKAPAQSGVFREYFSLVAEGAAWLNDPNMNFYMSVK